MRVLFVTWYPGYMRYYDGLIAELADRGNDVVVAFTNETKQAEGLEALDSRGGRVVRTGRVPKRRDAYEPVASTLRKVADYTRYLHPRYAQADHLRRRHEKFVPRRFRFLTRLPPVDARVLRATHRVLAALERAVPSSPDVERWVSDARPDVLVISPLVAAGRQTDVVKSAEALGVPTVLAVTSWDHLSTKGLVKARPDRTMVWNETQREEANVYHHIPPEEVTVTGAYPFDRWFGREPARERAAFCARVGLPADRPFVLFLGSTDSISDTLAEQRFVREWVTALRSSPDPTVREAAVLVRPHPYNPGTWAAVDASDLGDVAVGPRGGANPVDEADRADYFDSLYHCAAAVGINTSAMIEAAIVGRPVLTIRTADFADTQDGTVHFHYLRAECGGFVREATTLEGHAAQLAAVLSAPDAARDELSRFVGWFVRPLGLDRPATPVAADVIEETAALGPTGSPDGARRRPLRRGALRALAMATAGGSAGATRRRKAPELGL
jgi:hypothetical protein